MTERIFEPCEADFEVVGAEGEGEAEVARLTRVGARAALQGVVRSVLEEMRRKRKAAHEVDAVPKESLDEHLLLLDDILQNLPLLVVRRQEPRQVDPDEVAGLRGAVRDLVGLEERGCAGVGGGEA